MPNLQELTSPSNISLLMFIGFAVLILLGLLVIFRLLFQLGDMVAMLSLLMNGMRDILGARSFMLGCALFGFICLGCISATILTGLSVATCGTAHPSQFCQLLIR